MVSFLMDERHFSLLCIVVEDNGDYIKALVPFLSEHLHHMYVLEINIPEKNSGSAVFYIESC